MPFSPQHEIAYDLRASMPWRRFAPFALWQYCAKLAGSAFAG